MRRETGRYIWLPLLLPFALAGQDLTHEKNIMMPARDGVRLATDTYRLSGTTRVPVLLHRTPYDKSAPATIAIAEFFARHGYAVVVQDTRGRHASEGVFSKYYKYDAYDGYDTIEWAAKLPYSDGRVGMWGTSYAAHTQADAAKLNPPGLKTLVINMGGMSNAWDHSVRYDGAFEMGRQLTWAWDQILQDTRDPVVKQLLTKEKVTDWYTALPLRKGLNPLSAAPNYEGYYLDESEHSDYDEHWQSIGMQWEKFYEQTADIPMLHIGGWFDIYLRGTIRNFHELGRLKKSPEHLLIGPWTHHGDTETFAGDVDFGPSAALKDFDTFFHLRWFDHFFRNAPAGVETQTPVRFFVMGTGDGHRDAAGRLFHGGYWRNSEQWPPAEVKPVSFYLQPDGSLSAAAPARQSVSTYTFDPIHPVPTIGGGVSKRLKDGAFDQRERPDFPGSQAPYLPLRARRDILVFQTEPLNEDLDVVGPVTVELYASSSAVDTDFTAKLIDVYPATADFPAGFEMNLTDAILRASYRDGAKQRTLLKPNQIYKLTIRPFDTANHFKRGHRIRLDISSSNFPRFDVNPNTGEPLGLNRRMISADNSIYEGGTHASRVILNAMPAAR
jgi:putative CocE/NonD family hydrolase